MLPDTLPPTRLSFGSPDLPPNHLWVGDNLKALSHIPDGAVDLIYADPPFFTNRIHKGRQSLSFPDAWESLDAYLAWLRPRLENFRRILSSQGSLYLHLDYRAVHYAKVELDRIFGPKNFRNEIIWKYQMAGRSRRHFARKHDTLLFYSRSPRYYFDPRAVREPYTPHAHDRRGQNYGGRMGYDEEGRPFVEKWGTGRKRLYRYYLDEGKLASDVWEIEMVHPSSAERTGYPTQKPLALLDRMIRASCPEGGTLADFFLGSGTSLIAAIQAKRRFLGGDASPQAIALAVERLKKLAEERNAQEKKIPDLVIEPLPAGDDETQARDHHAPIRETTNPKQPSSRSSS